MNSFGFNGTYRRTKGEHHTYEYIAEWTDTGGDRATWSAKVRRNGELRGAPSGTLAATSTRDMIVAVRKLVEQSIEDLVQMDE